MPEILIPNNGRSISSSLRVVATLPVALTSGQVVNVYRNGVFVAEASVVSGTSGLQYEAIVPNLLGTLAFTSSVFTAEVAAPGPIVSDLSNSYTVTPLPNLCMVFRNDAPASSSEAAYDLAYAHPVDAVRNAYTVDYSNWPAYIQPPLFIRPVTFASGDLLFGEVGKTPNDFTQFITLFLYPFDNFGSGPGSYPWVQTLSFTNNIHLRITQAVDITPSVTVELFDDATLIMSREVQFDGDVGHIVFRYTRSTGLIQLSADNSGTEDFTLSANITGNLYLELLQWSSDAYDTVNNPINLQKLCSLLELRTYSKVLTMPEINQAKTDIEHYWIDPAGPPGIPQSLSIVPGNFSLSFAWSEPLTDGESPITGYLINLSPPDIAPYTVPPEVRTVFIPGLVNDAPYEVSVTAINAIASGPPATLPTTPADITGDYFFAWGDLVNGLLSAQAFDRNNSHIIPATTGAGMYKMWFSWQSLAAQPGYTVNANVEFSGNWVQTSDPYAEYTVPGDFPGVGTHTVIGLDQTAGVGAVWIYSNGTEWLGTPDVPQFSMLLLLNGFSIGNLVLTPDYSGSFQDILFQPYVQTIL